MVNVGKDTSPMDPMGYVSKKNKECTLRGTVRPYPTFGKRNVIDSRVFAGKGFVNSRRVDLSCNSLDVFNFSRKMLGKPQTLKILYFKSLYPAWYPGKF